MEPRKHSGLGIASFVMSLICGLSFAAVMLMGSLIAVVEPARLNGNSATTLVLGGGICGVVAMTFVTLGLGVGGLCQTDRKKLFAALGTAFSATVLVAIGGVIMLGLLVGP